MSFNGTKAKAWELANEIKDHPDDPFGLDAKVEKDSLSIYVSCYPNTRGDISNKITSEKLKKVLKLVEEYGLNDTYIDFEEEKMYIYVGKRKEE